MAVETVTYDLGGLQPFFRPRPRVVGRFLTVTRSGNLLFPRSAWDEIGRPGRVDLVFAREARLFGLQSGDGPTSYVVTMSSSGQVSAKAFLAHYGIDSRRAVRRRAYVQHTTLFARLDDEGTDVTRTYAPRR